MWKYALQGAGITILFALAMHGLVDLIAKFQIVQRIIC